MIRRVILLSIVAVTVLSTAAFGQLGSSSVNFLRIEPDARSGGLAGAGSTILDGGYGGYYNPALLGWQRGTVAGFSYSNWLPGFGNDYRYNHVMGGIELDSRSSLAGNLTYFSLGEQTATDASNTILGSFSSYQMAAGLSYGRLAGRQFSWGVGAKYIHSNLASGQRVDGERINPAGSLALDAGAMWRSGSRAIGPLSGEMRAGASVSNIGQGLQYLDGQGRSGLPQLFRSGVAFDFTPGSNGMHAVSIMADATKLLSRMERTVTAGDTTWNSMAPLRSLFNGWGSVERFNGQEMVRLGPLEQFGLGAGLEYWYNNLFAVRGGYYLENRNNGGRRYASVGTGLRYGTAEVDFSYLIAMQEDHPLDGTIRFSLKLHFSKGGYQAPRVVARRDRNVSRDPFEMITAEATPIQPIPVNVEEVDSVATEADDVVMVIDTAHEINASAQIIAAAIEKINMQLSGFATMSSVLSEKQRNAIADAVILLQLYPDLTIHIDGHTDDRGSQVLNDMLSQARARAIYLEMLEYGVIDWSRISIEGVGFSKPLNTETNTLARQLNRRGEIRMPATQKRESWVFEKPAGEMPELSGANGSPVNTGREFIFSWLELTESELSRLWLHSLARHLQENPRHRVEIANVVNYTSGSRAFMSELEKARSELLKDLLIRLDVAPSQIQILNDQNVNWKQYVDSIPSVANSERTWFFISIQ